MNMNADVLKGMWKQVKGQTQKTWGKLTNDDLDQINGSQEKLIGKLQERYGWDKAKAQQEVNNFMSNVNTNANNQSNWG